MSAEYTPTKIHERKPAPYPDPCPCDPGQWYWRFIKEKKEIIVYQCQCEPGQWPCSAIVCIIPTWDGDFGDIYDVAVDVANNIVCAVNAHDTALRFAETVKIMVEDLLRNSKGPGVDNFQWLKEQAEKIIALAGKKQS